MAAALVFFVAGIIISLFYHNWQPFLHLAVFSVITALITLGVVHGQEGLGQIRCTYRLMDE